MPEVLNPEAKEARKAELRELIQKELDKAKEPHAKFSDATLLHKYERELAELDGITFSD